MREFGDIEKCEEAIHSIQRTEERRKWNLNVGKKNPSDLGAPVGPIYDNLSWHAPNL